MTTDGSAAHGGDNDGTRSRIGQGMSQGHGAAPWMFLESERWSVREDWLMSLVTAGREDEARMLMQMHSVRLRVQVSRIGAQAANNQFFEGETSNERDDTWIALSGLYEELIEVAYGLHLNEGETMASVLERIREARALRRRNGQRGG